MVTRFAEHPAQRANGGRGCIHVNCYLLYSGSGVRVPDGALFVVRVWLASASFAKTDNSVTCGFPSDVGRFGDLTLNCEYRESSFGSHAADLRVVCRIRAAG